jgi:hypothetical protein
MSHTFKNSQGFCMTIFRTSLTILLQRGGEGRRGDEYWISWYRAVHHPCRNSSTRHPLLSHLQCMKINCPHYWYCYEHYKLHFPRPATSAILSQYIAAHPVSAISANSCSCNCHKSSNLNVTLRRLTHCFTSPHIFPIALSSEWYGIITAPHIHAHLQCH